MPKHLTLSCTDCVVNVSVYFASARGTLHKRARPTNHVAVPLAPVQNVIVTGPAVTHTDKAAFPAYLMCNVT